MNTDEARKAALADLAERDDDERCMAVHAVAVLDRLGFDEEASRQWDKLEGSDCVLVRAWANGARKEKPEIRQHLLNRFAKEHPV